ncbi:hypothetical protein T484DRAFT_2253173 [Baffinella frigidus]|nr:hypothetical protein T484DRAFT_2253173 [Cryptophyta sp. CCMP2293]
MAEQTGAASSRLQPRNRGGVPSSLSPMRGFGLLSDSVYSDNNNKRRESAEAFWGGTASKDRLEIRAAPMQILSFDKEHSPPPPATSDRGYVAWRMAERGVEDGGGGQSQWDRPPGGGALEPLEQRGPDGKVLLGHASVRQSYPRGGARLDTLQGPGSEAITGRPLEPFPRGANKSANKAGSTRKPQTARAVMQRSEVVEAQAAEAALVEMHRLRQEVLRSRTTQPLGIGQLGLALQAPAASPMLFQDDDAEQRVMGTPQTLNPKH